MPDRMEVTLFELGVRLKQCMRVFPAGVDDIEFLTPAYRRSLLYRLQNAFNFVFDGQDDHASLRRILEDILAVGQSSSEPANDDVHALLITLQTQIDHWLEKHTQGDRPALWFQLGIEIANGSGNLAENRLFQSDQGLLQSEISVPANWENHNQDRLQTIVEQLSAWEDFPGLETIFPIHDVNDDATALLPGTPDIYWGWFALEIGLQYVNGRTQRPEAARRRRGRRPDPRIAERDRWILQRHADHPELRRAALLDLLMRENEENNFGYELSRDILRNTLRQT